MLEHILNPPTEAMKVEILKDSNEDPGRLEHNMNLMEKWISCENHLPKNFDRNLLEAYLRGCKHNTETTKRKFEMYFVERNYGASYIDYSLSKMANCLKITSLIHSFPLPEMTQEGYRILLRKFEIRDASLFNMLDFLRYDTMLYEVRMHYDVMSAGQIMIYDLSNTNLPPLQKLLTPEVWNAISFTYKALPFRLKQFHVITNSSAIIKVVSFVKTFLPEKLAKRFCIHSNVKGVFKYIPQKLFPSDYGGSKKSCQELTDEWNVALMGLNDWFRQLEQIRIVGPIPKRLEQNLSEYFGPDGSFRKLDID